MEISDLELFNVPCSGSDEPHTLVRITSSDGQHGHGEGSLGWSNAELPDRRNALLAALAGRSVFGIADVSLGEATADFEPALRFAVETALWDLVGRTLGQPACNLWGGMYRPQVSLAMCLPVSTVLQYARLIGELLERGFHHLLLMSDGSIEQDLEAIELVGIAAGHSATLSLDACGRYSPDAALRLSQELPDDCLSAIVDPIADSSLATTCSLAQIMQTPVHLCRSIRRAEDVLAIIRTGGVRGAALDPARLGGILATRRAVAVASSSRLETRLYVGPSLGVASAAALHLIGSEADLGQHHYFVGAADVAPTVQGLRIADGLADIPAAPGLGVSVEHQSQAFG